MILERGALNRAKDQAARLQRHALDRISCRTPQCKTHQKATMTMMWLMRAGEKANLDLCSFIDPRTDTGDSRRTRMVQLIRCK